MQQATICPACIVLPQTTEDVADIIRTLANEGSSSQFAIRSGGHTSWAGASKIAGWTCDTALNFQVVLSDGQVVDANADENVDLFFAIRGGGCNFGIVTRIDMQTFEQGLFWNASQMRNTTVLDADIKEFVRLSTAEDCDEHASFILVFVYIGSMGMSVLVDTLMHTKGEENPPFCQNLMNLPAIRVKEYVDFGDRHGSHGTQRLALSLAHPHYCLDRSCAPSHIRRLE